MRNLPSAFQMLTIAFFGASIIVLVVLVWPKYQEFTALSSENNLRQENLEHLESYFQNVGQLKSQIDEKGAAVAKIDTALPADPALSSLFNFLQKTASQTGMILKSIGAFSITFAEQESSLKEIQLAKFVSGFNLEYIGETLVEKVVTAGFDTLEKIRNATVSDLIKVELFADITANQFYQEFHELYPQMVRVLDTNQVSIRSITMTSKKLEGLSFCFTGKLETITRNEANDLVSENGGTPKSSVVKGLSFLVTNSAERTSKLVKAEEQGTEVISEQEFFEMLK